MSWIHIDHVSVAMTMITRGAGDSGMGFSWYFIALFPGLPTVQVFDHLQYAKMKGEGLVPFITGVTSMLTGGTFKKLAHFTRVLHSVQ